MTSFTPIAVNNDRPISVTLSNNESKFADINTMMAQISVCFGALDPTGPNGPPDTDGTSTGTPLVFKTVTDENGNTQIVQASVSSTSAFQQDLQGLTINQGEAIIARTSNANAFGTSVGRGDALLAKVNNPTQDITNTTDWLRLEGDDSYSITLSERQFINTLTEEDVAVRVNDSSTETTITFYVLNTAATADGDLVSGQTTSFVSNADQPQGILYVRFTPVYVTARGEDNLYVEITDPGGAVSTFISLSNFTERTDLLVGGDAVYESAGYTHGTSINYVAGQTIKLWRTRTSRAWYFRDSFDVLRGLNDNTIPINKLFPSVQAAIRGHAQQTADIASIQARLDILQPLVVDLNILTDLADIYDPAQASEVVRIIPPYTRIADFRGTASTDHYESAGVTYDDTGTNIVDYSGLGDDPPRFFAFRVSAAANQTLMSLGNGGSVDPFISITSGGLLRLNAFIPARTQDQVVDDHIEQATLSTGTGTLSVGGADSTYTIPDYPANTSEQSRTVSVDLDILIGGTDTLAGSFIGTAEGMVIPDTDVAQARRTINHVANLGPLHGNRQIAFTLGYEFRVSGSDLLLDLDLDSAPSDVTMRVNNVTTYQSYTATAVIARVDNWQNFQTGAGDFTFSGDHEFLIEIVPRLPGEAGAGTRMEAVVSAINTTTGTISELNDIFFAEPPEGFDAVQIPDTIEFRTAGYDHYLRHSALSTLLGDRLTKWCYALARLETVTGHAFTAPINLTADSTINDNAFSREIKDAIGGTGDSVLTLPTDYTDFELLHVTVVEDAGQTMHAMISTRELDANATIANVRVAGNDTAAWNEAARTLTLHETTDTYAQALLLVPRLS